MRKIFQLLILLILYINAINSELSPLKDGTIYTIDENIEGASDYKTKTMIMKKKFQMGRLFSIFVKIQKLILNLL